MYSCGEKSEIMQELLRTDLTFDILKQSTFHDRVHYSLRIESLCKREVVRYIIRLTVVNRIIKTY